MQFLTDTLATILVKIHEKILHWIWQPCILMQLCFSSTRWHWIDYFGLEFFNYLSPLREIIIKQVPFLLAPYPPYRLTALSRLKLNVHVFLLPPQSILFCCFIGPADLLQVSLWFEFFLEANAKFSQMISYSTSTGVNQAFLWAIVYSYKRKNLRKKWYIKVTRWMTLVK